MKKHHSCSLVYYFIGSVESCLNATSTWVGCETFKNTSLFSGFSSLSNC